MSTAAQRPTRAVVLAGGRGRRMQAAAGDALSVDQAAAADRGVKAMMPLHDRTFLDHALSALADAGITSVCVVTGPDQTDIRRHYAAAAPRRLTIEFVVQPQPVGTCDAVRWAEGFCGSERFLVVNGDNHYPAAAVRRLLAKPGLGTLGFDAAALVRLGNIPAGRIAAFALLQVSADGTLAGIVEKPTAEQAAALGLSAPVSMNCWLLGPAFFGVARDVRRSPRGEYELPDAVRLLIDRGERIEVERVAAGVLDLSGRADVAAAARALAGQRVHL